MGYGISYDKSKDTVLRFQSLGTPRKYMRTIKEFQKVECGMIFSPQQEG